MPDTAEEPGELARREGEGLVSIEGEGPLSMEWEGLELEQQPLVE